jgi:hypothetical protein
LLLVLLVTMTAAVLASCTPRLQYEEVVHQRTLEGFSRWWTHEQAARNRVSEATIRQWLERSPARLDSSVARRGVLDVSTDLCSSSPDRGPGFDFRLPCIRHDVAWRNLRRGVAPNRRSERLRANARFEADARSTCERQPVLARPGCRALASLYRRTLDLVS